MASKRPNLAALVEAAGSVRIEPGRKAMPMAEANQTQSGAGEGTGKPHAPSRIGQKPITAFFPEEVRVQLKMMAAEQRQSMESLIGEALNDLFAKYGKPEIVGARTQAQ